MRARWLAFVGIGAAACGPPRPIPVLVPEGVDRAAALIFDEDGQLLRATGIGLVPIGGSLSIYLPDEPQTGWVVTAGFSSDSLAKAGAPADPALEQTALRVALPSDPWLPQPALVAAIDLATKKPIDLPEPLRLTVDWLPKCAPPGLLEASLDCEVKACGLSTTVDGCAIRIDSMGACGSFDAQLDAHNAVAEAGSDRFSSCTATTVPANAFAAFACKSSDGRCVIDIDRSDRAAAMSVRTVSLVPSVSATAAMPGIGKIPALVFSGARVVASTWDRPDGLFCDDPSAGHFMIVDPRGQASTESVVSPPCTTILIGSDGAPGFIGIYGNPRNVGFFDPGANLSGNIPLGVPFVTAADRRGPLLFLLAGLQPPDANKVAESALITVDLDARQIASRIALGRGGFTGLASIGTRLVVVHDDDTDEARAFTATGTPTDVQAPVSLTIGSGFGLHHTKNIGLVADPTADRFAVLVNGQYGGLTILAFGDTPPRFENLGRAVLFDGSDSVPTAACVWPADPALLLVALTRRQGTIFPRLALLDPVERRFLPHPVTLETGDPIEALVSSPDGGLVVGAHPCAGQLSFITPSAP